MRPTVAPALALVFILVSALVAALALGHQPAALAGVMAAAAAAYMALNIGANDVANNMGPAVGARAVSLPVALVLAAMAEVAGALIGGARVAETVGGGIVQPGALLPQGMVLAMTAALLAAAVWINIATLIGAPVSTTHSVVGGVVGAGLAAGGAAAIDWTGFLWIAGGWVVSPLLGGGLAAGLLALVSQRIRRSPDPGGAARRWVPRLFALMAGIFALYLGWTGMPGLPPLPAGIVPVVALLAALAGGALGRRTARRVLADADSPDGKKAVKALFAPALVAAGTLLSFAHGANDVSNAVGPLAAILAAQAGLAAVPGEAVAVPLWALALGGGGIALGLMLFGPKLIVMVGQEITRLNPPRAFCVALATALTVILASGLGMPVSSTHVALGAIFGIGFYREWEAARDARVRRPNTRPEEERERRRLVRRSYLVTIVAAWTVTVPVTAAIAGAIYALADIAAG
ncbi:inorganic phosphate transporter [Frigidibacter oleivorans]|uniref:inorganic phosphate transporter n=1 Tax=Frigidibacter oleivorans TaxID=2487129 RepID=UPI001F351BB4|nr:inorganic phosphate transporter [Frigidibacter oleivorans]